MKIEAIVYTSNTGYTEKYAVLLGKCLHLPVYSLKEALETLNRETAVIYFGWLMAGMVKGFRKADGAFEIKAVCGVGMLPSGHQTEEVRNVNQISEELPIFTLQGGFDMNRLHGMYKLMMKTVSPNMEKELAAREDRTEADDATLQMLRSGGNFVNEKHLLPLLEWCQQTV